MIFYCDTNRVRKKITEISDKDSIRISCLPVASLENPYQFLMIKGLNSDSRLYVKNGIGGKFLGIIKTAFIQSPHYIHFDWIESYYYRRKYFWTLLSVPSFVIQILFVKHVLGIRLVWSLHNISSHENKYPKLEMWCQRFLARQVNWIRVFSLTSLLRAKSQLKVPELVFKVVPEGSYVDYYINSISKVQARLQLNLPGDKIIILYLGLIKPYKGIKELVTSFLELNDNNYYLIIAGKIMYPDYYQTFGKIDHPNLKVYPSFVPDDKLQVFYNAADVVALPFKRIENSGSLINAMGFKKPVIAPRMGLIEDRLCQQFEILYESSILVGLQQIKRYSMEELEELGKKNFLQLQKHNWADYSISFIK